jgi:hypothetical protein
MFAAQIPIAEPAAQTDGAYLPRFRALALFERRPPERVDSSSLPASENLHKTGLMQCSKESFRGRDASYLAPPAQIRTCGFPAYGSHLGYQRQFGAVDEPTSCATLTRLGVRRVLSWRAFPSVPALRSTNSAADPSALFVGFPATMAWSDFSCPCIIGYGSSPSRCGPSRSRNI